MKPRKVLFVITKATYGGAQKYIYDLATHLPAQDFEVAVAYGTPGRLSENLREAGITLFPIPSMGRDIALISDIRSIFQLLRTIKEFRPDVIHLNSSKAAGMGALAARLCGVHRIIFTVHGWPFKEGRSALSRSLIYLISWWTAFLSTQIIVVSKTDEALGKKMLFCGNKISYIPLGIDIPPFFERNDAIRELSAARPEKPETADWPRIVTVGELTRNKGQSYALEAMALLKQKGIDVTYTLIGDGEDMDNLAEMANELRIIDRVGFARFWPNASRFLRAFDIFLLPSIKEGMPYVLLEAAAAGLPVVTTNVVDPAFLGEYENVRAVPPAEPEALAEALAETLRAREESPLFSSSADDAFKKMLSRTSELYR